MFCGVERLEAVRVIVSSNVLPWMTIALPHVYILVLSLLIVLIEFGSLTSFLLLLVVVRGVLGLSELVWLHVAWTMLDLIYRLDMPVGRRVMLMSMRMLVSSLGTVIGNSHVVWLSNI